MSKKILIVDDAIFMREILQNIVEKEGYEVIAAVANGRKAIEVYQDTYRTAREIDIIILDITMPDMDGITALKELKKINKDVSVVMCSAMTAEHQILKALQLGAKHFIGKPFNPEDVIKTLAKVGSRL